MGTRDESVMKAVIDWFDRREREYGFPRVESVTHLWKVVKEAGIKDFPKNKTGALEEFQRLGFETYDVTMGRRGIATYVRERA